MDKLHIYLGDYTYSSWSMRPWLVLRRSGLAFEETVLPLLSDEYYARIGDISPTRLVPVLHVEGLKITDSLAISEWIAEQVPGLWPEDSAARAEARAATAWMHGGFLNIRKELPVALRRDAPRSPLAEATVNEISAMEALWERLLETSGGPFLFGDWCIADAFFTPVASRFRSFHIEIGSVAQAYCDRLQDEPNYKEWFRRAQSETTQILAFDTDKPQAAGWLKDN